MEPFVNPATKSSLAESKLLEVRDLCTYFYTRSGLIKAVDHVSFDVNAGENVAIVGESGCGKSITALSIMRLVTSPPGKIVEGSIRLNGLDLLSVSEARMRRIRGNDISMVFQEPMTSLNPVLKVGRQISEILRLHEGLGRKEALDKVIDLLRLVHISEPERRAQEYPHQLSGGMRQRVVIAMALACSPQLLIADEPTTALDVTIQAQILDLIVDLKQRTKAAIIFITHDLGVVAEIAQRVIVMYAGRKVEEAKVNDLFLRPRHPYTVGLLASVPRLGSSLHGEAPRLQEMPGSVPSLAEEVRGCPFAPRCGLATDLCHNKMPPLEEHETQHFAACFHSDKIQGELNPPC